MVAISLLARALDSIDDRAIVQTVTQIAASHKSSLLILPGWSLGQGTLTEEKQNFLQNLAKETSVSMLADFKVGKNTTYFFSSDDIESFDPIKQTFALSGPDKRNHETRAQYREKVQRVLDEFVEGKRVLNFHGQRIGILLCGESNIVEWHRKENFVSCRLSSVQWPEHTYDILINPSHTDMSRTWALFPKFKYLSQNHKTLLYCANYRHDTHASQSNSLLVYHNGEEVINGEFHGNQVLPVKTEKGDNWRMVTVEIP